MIVTTQISHHCHVQVKRHTSKKNQRPILGFFNLKVKNIYGLTNHALDLSSPLETTGPKIRQASRLGVVIWRGTCRVRRGRRGRRCRDGRHGTAVPCSAKLAKMGWNGEVLFW